MIYVTLYNKYIYILHIVLHIVTCGDVILWGAQFVYSPGFRFSDEVAEGPGHVTRITVPSARTRNAGSHQLSKRTSD